jgi:hypothetical protein
MTFLKDHKMDIEKLPPKLLEKLGTETPLYILKSTRRSSVLSSLGGLVFFSLLSYLIYYSFFKKYIIINSSVSSLINDLVVFVQEGKFSQLALSLIVFFVMSVILFLIIYFLKITFIPAKHYWVITENGLWIMAELNKVEFQPWSNFWEKSVIEFDLFSVPYYYLYYSENKPMSEINIWYVPNAINIYGIKEVAVVDNLIQSLIKKSRTIES